MASGGKNRLQADSLFQALSRPTMAMGVTYMYFLLNMVVSLLAFIHTESFTVLLVAMPGIHLIGYLICLREPRALELFILRSTWGFKSMNRRFHGHTNSYDVF